MICPRLYQIQHFAGPSLYQLVRTCPRRYQLLHYAGPSIHQLLRMACPRLYPTRILKVRMTKDPISYLWHQLLLKVVTLAVRFFTYLETSTLCRKLSKNVMQRSPGLNCSSMRCPWRMRTRCKTIDLRLIT